MMMKWMRLLILILLSILLFYFFQPQASPTPSSHPRVYVTSADLSSIERKLSVEPFKTSWDIIQKDTNTLSLAFKYLIQQNLADGELAITKSLEQLRKTDDIRSFHNAMMVGACVYDWCYPLLDVDQKQAFIDEFTRIAALHDPGYPAS
jgi:hypothetical protein